MLPYRGELVLHRAELGPAPCSQQHNDRHHGEARANIHGHDDVVHDPAVYRNHSSAFYDHRCARSISTAQFVQWNPAAKSDCSGLWASTWACVGIIGNPVTTTTGNGVATPAPIQPGMVTSCNKFYQVKSGDTCDAVAFWGGAPGTQWVKQWNPAVGADCRGLQAGTWACVGVISGNGISTPLPTQTGMVRDCNKFYHVNSGDTCDAVAFWGGAPGMQSVIKWNPAVGPECRTLQAGTYACVGVVQ
ncbi:hypothetical protein C8A05DRAFT_37524 [Staphylotrichum tortipilum]|uniref:LysM domain-containing protein n=1 Tax=Staphylotrichum tortipilum TaxID=2831512 RepID=A0AAN6RQ49_9PEZI|nr:hypothetical protein C8A05DRAFT_37524 [Staphylotrichum longicolle]